MYQQQPRQEQDPVISGSEVDTMADSQRKTANLVDTANKVDNKAIIVTDNTVSIIDSSASFIYTYLSITSGNYTIKAALNGSLYSSNARAIAFYDINKNYISGISYSVIDTIDNGYTFTVPDQTAFTQITCDKAFTDVMLNAGSTAEPYEPYGWVSSIKIYDGTTWQTAAVKEYTGTDWQ